MAKDAAQEEDLFSAPIQTLKETVPEVESVTQLTKKIRDLLELRFADVTVEGEISNFLHHRSGHRYWTLKDETAQISCVFWKTRSLSFDIDSGQKVVCRGRLSLYAPRGSYQLDVFQVRPVGIGALQLAFEKLFKKLQEEGLFDESRKRSIPKYPKRIGIVTSATGAAIHDILTVLRRRYPLAEVLIRPASVQGIGSELQVAQGIKDFNILPIESRPDVLIVGRGGGSLEDLWTFNEEAVARAIYASAIPIVSAVGHEVDVTIADFVADLRAPTPTAAAELITPDKRELLDSLRSASSVLEYRMNTRLTDLRAELSGHSSGYGLKYVLKQAMESRRDTVGRYFQNIEQAVEYHLERSRLTLDKFSSTLRVLDPNSILSRGYAIVHNEQGKVITEGKDFPVSSEATLLLQSGKVTIRRIQ